MGNRVLIQFTDGVNTSPAIYGHWAGREAPAALLALRIRMNDRPADVEYIAARCLQELGMNNERSTGFGIFNATDRLGPEDSQGDAGVFVVTVGPIWKVRHLGGYPCERPEHPGIEWQ